MNEKILLVEDDIFIAQGVKYALESDGFAVLHASTVSKALELIRNNSFSLAVLDMRLPDGNGCKLREELPESTAIIFLTVDDEEETIVKAFDDGADDYITKPFRIRELSARIKAILRRRSDEEAIEFGRIKIDTAAGRVYVDGNPTELTALEYRMLVLFMSNKGKLLTRNRILEDIWDSSGNFVEDNTLTVYIKRLRERLCGAIELETVRGMGYRLVDSKK